MLRNPLYVLGAMAVVLGLTLAGCPATGADDDDDNDASDDDVADDDVADDDTDDREPLDACMEDSGIGFDCPNVGDVHWAAAGEDVPCLGSMGGGNVARFTFWLDQVVDTSPMILGLRLEQEEGWNPTTGDRVSFDAPVPVHLTPESPLSTELDWTASILPMAFAGALAFTEGYPETSTVFLGEALALGPLMDGVPVSGTFTLAGGSWIVLDGDGNEQTIDDTSAEGFGCFNVPSELYPLDLD